MSCLMSVVLDNKEIISQQRTYKMVCTLDSEIKITQLLNNNLNKFAYF